MYGRFVAKLFNRTSGLLAVLSQHSSVSSSVIVPAEILDPDIQDTETVCTLDSDVSEQQPNMVQLLDSVTDCDVI